jgi:Tol biopolymer transport system component
VSLLVAVVAVAFALTRLGGAPPDLGTVRFQIPPPDVTFIGLPCFSPDGRYLAFDATDPDGVTHIWIRPLSEEVARVIPGSEGAERPFWSPDSRYVGFFADDKLKKIAVPGGAAVTVCDAPGAADGAWNTEGTVLFDGGLTDSIQSLATASGAIRPATNIDRSLRERGHAWPEFLPDGRHFLYLSQGDYRTGAQCLKIGCLDSDLAKVLDPCESRAEYADPGYLLYVAGGNLVARPFSAHSLEFTGEPRVLAQEVNADEGGRAYFSVSQNGNLAYRVGGTQNSQLVWVDRAGREVATVGATANYDEPSRSPDGTRVAVAIQDSQGNTRDIWVLEPSRGIATRLTYDAADDRSPLWSADGSEIFFCSDRTGKFNIHSVPASGTGEAKAVLVTEDLTVPVDQSADGRFLLYYYWNAAGRWNIGVLPTEDGQEPFDYLATPFSEAHPRLSPDGKFLAYASNEAGTWEIYVRTFPEPTSKWRISNRGGLDPQWRGDGQELFYITMDRTLMSVEISTDPDFRPGTPQPLFTAPVGPDPVVRNRYVAAPDGQRFLCVSPHGADPLSAISVVINWPAELAKD